MKKGLPLIVLLVMAAMLMISWGNVSDMKTADVEKYKTLMQQGERFEEKEIYVDAVKQYDAALKLKPEYSLAMRVAGLYKELNNDKKYISTLETAISCDRENPEPYFAIIEMYEKQGNTKKLYKMLTRTKEALEGSEQFTEEQSWKINQMLKDLLGNVQVYRFLFDECCGSHRYEGSGATMFKVMKDGKYGLLDSKLGSYASCQYDEIGFAHSSLIPICKDGEYYFIDTSGNRKIVSEQPASALGAFGSGVAPLQVGGKYGYIDTKMNESHYDYEFAGSFENGIAPVKQNGKWFVIDKQYKPIGPNFDEILIDCFGFCAPYGVYFGRSGNTWGMYTTTGEKIADGFDEVRQFASQEPTAVKKSGKWIFVSLSGETVLETTYSDAGSFSLGYAPVKQGDLWGCINQDGEMLIDPQFNALGSFDEEGYAIGENADGLCSVFIRQYQ